MPELCEVYGRCLKEHGLEVTDRIHSGRLRERVMAAVPDLVASNQGKGKETILLLNSKLGHVLKTTLSREAEALSLARAAEVVRKEIFKSKLDFTGRFGESCQEQSVPSSLKALIEFILDRTRSDWKGWT